MNFTICLACFLLPCSLMASPWSNNVMHQTKQADLVVSGNILSIELIEKNTSTKSYDVDIQIEVLHTYAVKNYKGKKKKIIHISERHYPEQYTKHLYTPLKKGQTYIFFLKRGKQETYRPSDLFYSIQFHNTFLESAILTRF